MWDDWWVHCRKQCRNIFYGILSSWCSGRSQEYSCFDLTVLWFNWRVYIGCSGRFICNEGEPKTGLGHKELMIDFTNNRVCHLAAIVGNSILVPYQLWQIMANLYKDQGFSGLCISLPWFDKDDRKQRKICWCWILKWAAVVYLNNIIFPVIITR